MEIHVNGKPVAKIDNFVRSISISGDEGAITRFDTAPTSRIISIETEHRVDANAPRLDEIEFLHYIDALDKGLLSGDGKDDGTVAEKSTERISESEYPTAEERAEEQAKVAEENLNEHNEDNVGESSEGDIENRTNLGDNEKDSPEVSFGIGANRDGSGEME